MSKLQKRSPSPAPTLGRSSFSSIREHDSDYNQTFTRTKISSYNLHAQQQSQKQNQHQDQTQHQQQQGQLQQTSNEVAVVDESASPILPASPAMSASSVFSSTLEVAPWTSLPWTARNYDHDHDMSGFQDVIGRSLAWLEDGQNGFQASTKRQDSLLKLDRSQVAGTCANMDDADTAMEDVVDELEITPDTKAPIEKLPLEVYRLILNYLVVDQPPNGIDRRNVDLMSLLVTSQTLHAKTLETLYRRVTVPHSRIFQKFRAQLEASSYRGAWVRRLDFSHFNPVSLFSTASEREAARNLTSETLLRCLELTPYLQEFLVQDYLDNDLSEAVLRKLITGLPALRALDLCGCSSVPFRNAFTSFIANTPTNGWPDSLDLQRLSLHKCISLPSTAFEFLLPKLHHLTHLDVAGTRITNEALQSIPTTARISHLNLAKCPLLTADSVIDFLQNHPAVNQNTLVFLSLGFDAATSQLFNGEELTRLLPILPTSLRSLSLKGSKMDQTHLPQLQQLSCHLEELALGRGYNLADIKALVVPAATVDDNSSHIERSHSLRYLDLTDMDTDDFDLSYLYLDSKLLNPESSPLEVMEVTEDVFRRVTKGKGALTRMGWRQSEIGSRSWLVRGPPPSGNISTILSGNFAMENGQRPWKMGAQSWGMRKVPVAHAKVGGMYGSYMFGRKL